MTATVWISISCPDRTGLIAQVAGALFDLGANLGDTSFAVLGTSAEFTSVCELPGDVELEAVRGHLADLDVLRDAEIVVRPFTLATLHGPLGRVTHQVEVGGGDRPGLIARLCEAFAGFGANVVRLSSERVPGPAGDTYRARFAVSIPEASTAACLATVSNTAEALQLDCRIEPV